MTHGEVNHHTALLHLTCRCGAHRELCSALGTVRLAVVLSGWTLAPAGTAERDECPECHAARTKGRGST